jgi:type I restriction enzyme, R subunit
VLKLVQHFVPDIEEENDRGRGTGKKTLIFPRYHQLDTVRRLIQDAHGRGTGQRCLVQHSAGSGTSMSIAWLDPQLSSPHAADDRGS